ncbi:MAG: transglycosylase SLT domain-containing protein [Hydrogenophaga sp.]|uniref:transglycosylase SLT domain-containing protein n=1 Tax=Hydrogenophaga sp. TaxID=1904254 RepID=UPI00262DF2D9|nr:transglycosylase SLT domain-containing protein [Hydrogenophaga sp.]MCV0437336.1 transglycosylase SLT domain-containing protein [Hydrogenophaga sp.]
MTPASPAARPAPRTAATPSWLKLATASLALFVAGCATTVVPDAPSTPAPAPEPVAATRPSLPSYRLPSDIPLQDIAIVSTSPYGVTTLDAPTDLWDRIRRGFAMPDLDNDMVRDREQWYATRPDYMQRMTERSRRYLFHIVEEIELRNMPMELALLPFIESAFNPQAVSSARAAGMWQFMPATGESFDLKQNAFRDDRRDVLASTRAALDYLQQLHGRFGDWHLALAAYNWGQGNVNRAITRNQRQGLPTGYTDINMPLETRMYVPKLQAVKNILARPQDFNATLPLIGNHPFFDTVTLLRDMDVELIARLAEVEEKDFRVLNPSLRQPVVMAAGTPHVLLPWDNAIIFQRNLLQYTGPLASWTAWVVPSTMTAAQAAARVGMSEEELRAVNNIPPRMRVRAGSSLLVPRTEKRNGDVPIHVADNAQLNLQPEATTRRGTVTVRKGDTLSQLARRYDVSVASLAAWNRISVKATLRVGQRLTVQLPQRATQARSSSAKKVVSSTARKPVKAKATASKTRVATSSKTDKKSP